MYVTWDESLESVDDFLRYQLWRRVQGETEWSKRARITNRGITFWDDTIAHSSTVYEYGVTQVIDVSGEEIESEMSGVVSAELTIVDIFLHDVFAPENYVQVQTPTHTRAVTQPITFVQPWSRRAPTAHISHVISSTYKFGTNDVWNEEQWLGLLNLMDRQHESGAVLMVRQDHDIAMFGQMESPLGLSENGAIANSSVNFRETYYREEVD